MTLISARNETGNAHIPILEGKNAGNSSVSIGNVCYNMEQISEYCLFSSTCRDICLMPFALRTSNWPDKFLKVPCKMRADQDRSQMISLWTAKSSRQLLQNEDLRTLAILCMKPVSSGDISAAEG